MTLLEALAALPDTWALVAVDGQKRAYQPGWQNNPLTKDQAAAEIRAGRAKAIGVCAGPSSGGLLFVDLDGISAAEQLDKLGLPVRSLPKSPAVTSGRDGRFQIIYSVPPEYWPAMKGRRVFKTGKLDAQGKAENLDLRWAGHYSVVIGAHPETSGYRWLRDRSPETQPFSDAPTALIELLLEQPEPDPAPLLAQPVASRPAEPTPPTGGPLPFLDFITRTSRDLIESGGTPGSWNDDQLALALDLLGTESWILAQGHSPDVTARDAFSSHIAAARLKARDFDDRKAWHRFDGAVDLNPTAGTPLDKLLSRLAYHTRLNRPILQPQKSGPPPRDPQTHRSQAVGTSPTHTDSRPYAPTFDKPSKLEAAELLYMLRSQAGHDGIRFNVFTQQIEIEGRVLTGADRYYLRLAQQGFKVPKDLAFDCLVDVAHEHPYDPVALYLDHVAATVPPTYIDSLATTYLRPEDHVPGGKPTLYDHMLKATLIGAVRRVFEPGCKHDTACVLMGDQGARKSSFWSVLGGEFFSDALKDISSKDDLMVMHRSWIMEWAELDHVTSRKHAGHIKAFLSQATDLYRKPYGKATEDFPRRGIIVGSTNRSTGFLVDDTGNRRFWVIPTAKNESDPIDTAQLMAERDAIWAAAVIAYRAGELNYLPPELAQQVTSENESYQVENPWRAPLEAWLRAPDNRIRPITSELLLTEAIQKPIERQTRADQMQVGSILRELGYEKRRQVVDGVLRWVYFQP